VWGPQGRWPMCQIPVRGAQRSFCCVGWLQ
jgi:hypothetical protein